tara:strand:- start:504 stop:1031 length:528 start_codon:yes stop_codon:yes gene_type:complete
VKRECGECGECCFTLGIKELSKPERQNCKHFCDGCQIYDDRPTSCADWNCMWLKGHLPQSQRPDKTNIVFHLPDGDTSRSWGGRLVLASESRPSSSKFRGAEKSIRKMFKAGNNIMITRFDGSRVLHLHRGYLAKILVESRGKGIVPSVNGNIVTFTTEQAGLIWPDSAEEKEVR